MAYDKEKRASFRGRNFVFRQAGAEDAKTIFSILQEAVAYFGRLGVPQWQDGYPDLAVVREDVAQGRAFLLEEGEKTVGIVTFCAGYDATYDYVCSGGFSTDSYAVLHRLAVSEDEKGQGLGGLLIRLCAEMAKERRIASLRCDTILANTAMCRLTEKEGFRRCAEIDPPHQGGKRICFEKLLGPQIA